MNKEELSEFIGIMLGDGNIYTKNKNYRIVITGHSEEDYDYLINYVKPLAKTLFKKEMSLWRYKHRNAIALALYSKEVTDMFESLSLFPGPKKMIIPKFIKSNKKYIAPFLRGVADTDFCITFKKKLRKNHSYPILTSSFSNKQFVKELKRLINGFNISCSTYEFKKKVNNKMFNSYQIDIYGKENLIKWMKEIGLKNKKHLMKIKIWKKLGYYKPHTSYKERLKILNKKAYK